jgi:hypothetical protein
MTSNTHNAIEGMTGHRPVSCPWAALFDPFVHRVIVAHEHYENGRPSLVTQPSHRLVEGVSLYSRTLDSIEAQQLEEARKKAEAS